VSSIRHASYSRRPKPKSKVEAKAKNEAETEAEGEVDEGPELDKKLQNPLLARYLQQQQQKKANFRSQKQSKLTPGGLGETTIFTKDHEIGIRDDTPKTQQIALRKAQEERVKQIEKDKAAELERQKLDPYPEGRQRWERRKVIQGLKKRGRVTHDIKLLRTERQSLFKSKELPTSTKKLTRIMEMVKGKTVEEAMVQLRFSKKKVAQDVLKGLILARDKAIVAKGMGLGRAQYDAVAQRIAEKKAKKEVAVVETDADGAVVETEIDAEDGAEEENDPALAEADASKAKRSKKPTAFDQLRDTELLLPDGTRRFDFASKGVDPITIELKDGSHKKIYDPTEIYVDQAWVGKGGNYTRSPEFRARGKVNMLTHRTAGKSPPPHFFIPLCKGVVSRC